MNGYAVYKVQTRSSIKDKQVKEIIPSPVSSLVGQKCSQKTKKVATISKNHSSPFWRTVVFLIPVYLRVKMGSWSYS